MVKPYRYEYDGTKNLRRKYRFDQIRKRPGRCSGPNKTELRLWKILGPSFQYTGNGSKTIDGKRPDFVDETSRIIVELYGLYWHRADTLAKTMNRINTFAKAGYRTLIVWEDEIDKPLLIRRKLLQL